MTKSDTKIDKGYSNGSGNVFADLGFPDAEAHQTKARLVQRISKLIEARGLTQVKAAELLGMSQPDVSKMLRGQFRPISIDRLMQCLLVLGDNIEISINSPRVSVKTAKRGKLRVFAA